MNAPFTIFGKTLLVPVVVYLNGHKTDLTEWDEELWIERGEDWYGLGCSKGKRVRIIERNEWLKAVKRAERLADEAGGKGG